MKRSATVLLLSADPMAAALLGMLAEIAGYVPAFPAAEERPEEAVARIRPLYVVLLDGSLDAARSDLFFGRAARRRVGLAVLLPRGSELPLAHWARDRDVPCCDVPTDPQQFARLVDTAQASNWWRSGRDRRCVPRIERGADGSLIYVDRHAHRWRVYDGRGTDRRSATAAETEHLDGRAGAPLHGAAAAPPVLDLASDALPDAPADVADGVTARIFVGEAGDAWWCPVAAVEPTPPPALALERQFGRAIQLEKAAP